MFSELFDPGQNFDLNQLGNGTLLLVSLMVTSAIVFNHLSGTYPKQKGLQSRIQLALILITTSTQLSYVTIFGITESSVLSGFIFAALGASCAFLVSLPLNASPFSARWRKPSNATLTQRLVYMYGEVLIEEFIFRIILNLLLFFLLGDFLLGIILSSAMFAAAHIRSLTKVKPILVLNGFAFGICLSLSVATFSFEAAVALHLSWNAFAAHFAAGTGQLRLRQFEESFAASACYAVLALSLLAFLATR